MIARSSDYLLELLFCGLIVHYFEIIADLID